jgi:hypothetical protein
MKVNVKFDFIIHCYYNQATQAGVDFHTYGLVYLLLFRIYNQDHRSGFLYKGITCCLVLSRFNNGSLACSSS